ncbi:MAG: ABC transporter permease [Pyrinomonadaceae bacterium]|nr:ABC transporter permease [Pyrinomonadaceae bacterium]
MDTLWQDLRYGFRMLLKSPGFTLIAILALALGIGANTAIFSVVNAVLLKPLPYKDPNQLVILWEKSATQDTSVAYLNFQDWRDQNQSFEQIAAFRRDSFNLTGAGEPERLAGRMTSATFFSTLGAKLFKGADFPAAEDRVGGQKVVILGYGFWQRRFGGDDSIVGKQLTLNNQSYTVLGITAPDFRFGSDTDIYTLIGQSDDQCFKSRGCHPGIYVIGRLKPGVSIEQGRSDMDAIMGRLGQQYPDTNTDRRIHIESLYDNTVQDVRPALFILLGAVGFVLLIACANVANLLLARSAVRQKEIAIRTALGASRWRIVRQLLTESVVLGITGGVIGLLLALWWTDALKSLVPGQIPRITEAGMDMRVLGFTIIVSILTGVIFGLIPALQASKPDLNEALKEGDRGSTGSRHRVRSALVVAEIAIAAMLLVGAGLMVKSLWRLQSVNTGFETRNLLTMQLSYTARQGEAERARRFFMELEEKIKNTPGVESAAFSTGLPFMGASENSLSIKGRPKAKPQDEMMSVEYMVTPDYFRTLGIELKRGRLIGPQDRAGSPLVAVIDESFAQKYFPNEDPIGKYLENGIGMKDVEIVGIVGHVKHYGLDGEVPVDPQYYIPLQQMPDELVVPVAKRIGLSVRTSGDPMTVVPAIRQQVLSTDSNQPVFNVRSMEQVIAETIAPRRFAMQLLTLFASVALLLASVGIYGVMSYSVTQRTHEIGIRMALGASARDVLKMVVGQGMLLVLIGLICGLVGAFGVTRVMSSLLFGVSATDPLTFVSISVLLALVAFIACYVPARRATRVDPMTALRYE